MGEVLWGFSGWLKDVALKKSPRIVKHHPTIGLLVSAGNRVLRYDADTGDFIQTLLELESDAEVTSFLLE